MFKYAKRYKKGLLSSTWCLKSTAAIEKYKPETVVPYSSITLQYQPIYQVDPSSKINPFSLTYINSLTGFFVWYHIYLLVQLRDHYNLEEWHWKSNFAVWICHKPQHATVANVIGWNVPWFTKKVHNWLSYKWLEKLVYVPTICVVHGSCKHIIDIQFHLEDLVPPFIDSHHSFWW